MKATGNKSTLVLEPSDPVNYLTSTETTSLIRDGEKGEGIEVRQEGDYIYIYRYTVTTRITPALRWAETRAVLMFH